MAIEKTDRQIIEINSEYLIPFLDIHPDYGRAEFEICTKWKRGKISDVWIVPRQQLLKPMFHYKPERPYQKSFSLQGYDGLEDPKVWRSYWCKLHQTQCLEMYVPAYSKYLWIDPLSTLTIGFLSKPAHNTPIYREVTANGQLI